MANYDNDFIVKDIIATYGVASEAPETAWGNLVDFVNGLRIASSVDLKMALKPGEEKFMKIHENKVKVYQKHPDGKRGKCYGLVEESHYNPGDYPTDTRIVNSRKKNGSWNTSSFLPAAYISAKGVAGKALDNLVELSSGKGKSEVEREYKTPARPVRPEVMVRKGIDLITKYYPDCFDVDGLREQATTALNEILE